MPRDFNNRARMGERMGEVAHILRRNPGKRIPHSRYALSVMKNDQLYQGLESTRWSDQEKKWALRELEIRHRHSAKQMQSEEANIADLAKASVADARRIAGEAS